MSHQPNVKHSVPDSVVCLLEKTLPMSLMLLHFVLRPASLLSFSSASLDGKNTKALSIVPHFRSYYGLFYGLLFNQFDFMELIYNNKGLLSEIEIIFSSTFMNITTPFYNRSTGFQPQIPLFSGCNFLSSNLKVTFKR